jgi:hypothetical protein
MQKNTHELKLEYFSHCRQQREKIIGVVGNNADHFSALWATTLKSYRCCRQQREIITTSGINIQIIKTSL